MANTIRFESSDIVNDTSKVTTSTWTNNQNNLNTAHTSSIQSSTSSPTSSGAHFVEIYNEATVNTSAEVQYAIAYGHKAGSGSLDYTNDIGALGNSPSRIIYNQYRQLVFGDENSNFTFNGFEPDDIYVININRARYKQRLTLGSLNLKISGNNSALTAQGGAGAGQSIIHLTDDSVTNTTAAGTSVSLGPYWNLVSGSSGVVGHATATTQIKETGSYGFVYPEAGLIIMNGEAFGNTLSPRPAGTGLPTNTDRFHQRLVRHISCDGNTISVGAVAQYTGSFIVDSTEEINSEFYFARARNDQFNYTNNESFVDASKNIRFETMKLNPKVFITTVGLYNDAFECLAIAKLSQPVAKDFTKEALIRVKLDY